ncbi:MAG: DUF1376 domain-containing protein [Enhydrobacter sp.]|nr:DUF1376 domain-containing protein [Enhydrobacter sp.]
MTELPSAPVPLDADLTDFRFMPLEVERLRRSRAWLICKRRPELAFFMLNLWTAAWHSRPAGSLEDDDDVLADAAMCSPERWPEIRADVMRGWFKASDGRLYHPVVAEKVLDSWHGKAVARWRKECERIRKENGRREKKGLPPLDLPPEPLRGSTGHPPEAPARSEGCPPEQAATTGSGPMETQRPSVGCPSETGPPSVGHAPDDPALSQGPPDNPAPSAGHPADVQGFPPENALKGEGEERDRKVRKSSEAKASAARAGPGERFETSADDPKAVLFGPKVRSFVRDTTGKPWKSVGPLIGNWCKAFDQDHAALLAVLVAAQDDPPGNLIEWIGGAARRRKADLPLPPPKTAAEAIQQMQADPAWQGVVR